jgi:hypothetical protein
MPRGRRSIFTEKDPTTRVQGILTKIGRHAFERARRQLRGLVMRITRLDPTPVSDADTVEFLARGEESTRAYLLKKR